MVTSGARRPRSRRKRESDLAQLPGLPPAGLAIFPWRKRSPPARSSIRAAERPGRRVRMHRPYRCGSEAWHTRRTAAPDQCACQRGTCAIPTACCRLFRTRQTARRACLGRGSLSLSQSRATHTEQTTSLGGVVCELAVLVPAHSRARRRPVQSVSCSFQRTTRADRCASPGSSRYTLIKPSSVICTSKSTSSSARARNTSRARSGPTSPSLSRAISGEGSLTPRAAPRVQPSRARRAGDHQWPPSRHGSRPSRCRTGLARHDWQSTAYRPDWRFGRCEARSHAGEPVIADRAHQARQVSALEPEWEGRLEPKSYGFRPGRGCMMRSSPSTRSSGASARDAVGAIARSFTAEGRQRGVDPSRGLAGFASGLARLVWMDRRWESATVREPAVR